MLEGMLRTADMSRDPAQQIEIWRAVALMRIRLWGVEDALAIQELRAVTYNARCFYGERAQLTCDLRETLLAVDPQSSVPAVTRRSDG
jgi:hypothetical protein